MGTVKIQFLLELFFLRLSLFQICKNPLVGCYCENLNKCTNVDTSNLSDSVANSGRSSVIAGNLGLLVGQNRCRFLKMTQHN